MSFYVYILYSDKRSKYYVGQTNNILERFERHNQGYVKSTKSGVPWRLIWTIEFHKRSEAMDLQEKRNKKVSIGQ